MPVEVKVHAQNMQVNDNLHDYVTTKVSKLDRYISGVQEARVDLTYSKTARNASDRHVAQITLRGKRFILRSEERTDDIYSAFDTALDKIQRRIEKFKGKRYRGRGDGTSVADTAFEALNLDMDALEDDEPSRVIRRKKFMLFPMNEAEAIEQMDLLGHEEFFVFYNPETNSVNVLYSRRDGTLGLIETEVA